MRERERERGRETQRERERDRDRDRDREEFRSTTNVKWNHCIVFWKYDKKSKCSNDPYSQILTELLHRHLPYIISHREHFSCFMQLENRTIAVLVQTFIMSFNKSTSCGNMLNFIQIHTLICEKMDTKIFDFSYNCDLELKAKIIRTDIKM